MSPFGGDKRDRTADPLLAKQVLSQLSYTPAFKAFCLIEFAEPQKLNNDKGGPSKVSNLGCSDLRKLDAYISIRRFSLERR